MTALMWACNAWGDGHLSPLATKKLCNLKVGRGAITRFYVIYFAAYSLFPAKHGRILFEQARGCRY